MKSLNLPQNRTTLQVPIRLKVKRAAATNCQCIYPGLFPSSPRRLLKFLACQPFATCFNCNQWTIRLLQLHRFACLISYLSKLIPMPLPMISTRARILLRIAHGDCPGSCKLEFWIHKFQLTNAGKCADSGQKEIAYAKPSCVVCFHLGAEKYDWRIVHDWAGYGIAPALWQLNWACNGMSVQEIAAVYDCNGWKRVNVCYQSGVEADLNHTKFRQEHGGK